MGLRKLGVIASGVVCIPVILGWSLVVTAFEIACDELKRAWA